MRKSGIAAIALSLALATTLAAQQKEAPPPAGTPKNFSVPAVKKFDLPNGLRVRLVPYGEVPKATIRLVTQVGNSDEGPNEIWLSDLIGDLIEQGTPSRSADAIARQVAGMGGSLDVNVTIHQTNIGTDILSEFAVPAIELISDVARNPRLPESELVRLKDDMKRNLSIARGRPQTLASEKFNAVLFPDHAYGRIYPTAEMIDAWTIDQVRGFYERTFGAARSSLYVVGRFDGPAVEAAIRSAFGGWKAGTPPAKVTVSPVSRRGIYLVDRPGSVQSTLTIGLPTIDPTSDDYLGLVVMNALLGGSFGSRITSNIREQKGYTYSPNSSVATRLGAGTWAETADVTTNVTGASIKEILGEIERLRGEAPPAQELRGIQNYLAGTFVLRNSSRAGIIAQLSFLDLYGLSEDFLRTYVQKVYTLTPADVQRMAQQHVDPAKLAIVVVGDRAAVTEQLAPFGAILP